MVKKWFIILCYCVIIKISYRSVKMIWKIISPFLVFVGVLFISPMSLNGEQLSNHCVYRDPNDSSAYIGVDASGTPYKFAYDNDDNLTRTSYPGAVGSVSTDVEKETDEYRAGHSFSGTGTCPRSLSLYEMDNGDVHFHIVSDTCNELINSSIGNLPDAGYDIVSTECPWVFDHSTVRMGWCYYDGSQQDNITSSTSFSAAMDDCVSRCQNRSGLSCTPYNDVRVLWSSLDPHFSIAKAEGIDSEEAQEIDEEQARQDREEAMHDLVNCWEQHHPEEMANCHASYGEEFDDHIKDCVREAAGADYQCGSEHDEYSQALQSLTDMRAASDIDLNLTELTCDQLLGEANSEIREFIVYMFYMILFIGLALLIVMTSLDYAKVVGSGGEDSDMLKKANSRVFKRIGIFALLAFLPVIILVVFEIFGDPLGIHENCMEELFRN